MNKLPQILKELRAQKGIDQKSMARTLHRSAGTISNYENGIHEPDLDTIVQIADYFDVTADYLLGRTDCCLSSEKQPRMICTGYSVGRFLNLLHLLPEKDRLFLAHLFRTLERLYAPDQKSKQSLEKESDQIAEQTPEKKCRRKSGHGSENKP